MNDWIKLILISVANITLCYFIWILIKPSKKQTDEKIEIQEPNEQSKLVYEKAALDINLKKLEDLLIVEQSEIGRILIHEQLAIMRRYSNVLAVRIALS